MPDTTWLAINALMLGFGAAMTIKALWSRKTGRYVFAWWDGGALFRGKSVSSTRMVFAGVAAFLAPLVLDAWVIWHQHPEFACPVPSGWVDVSQDAPDGNLSRIPPAALGFVREQRRKVQALAVEISGDEEPTITGLYSAEEVHKRAVLTPAFLEQTFEGFRKGAPPGVTVELRDRQVISRGQHRIGRIEASTLVSGMRKDARIFVVAGGRHYVLLTCIALQMEPSHCPAALDETLDKILAQTAPDDGAPN